MTPLPQVQGQVIGCAAGIQQDGVFIADKFGNLGADAMLFPGMLLVANPKCCIHLIRDFNKDRAAMYPGEIPLAFQGIQVILLDYDPSIISADKVIMGSLTGTAIYDYQINPGKIKVSLAMKDCCTGNGTVAYVAFNVIGNPGQSSKLNITNLSANNASYSAINILAINGIFRVTDPGSRLKGDVNGDGKITAFDALLALQMAVDKIPDDPVADMNNDNNVTSIDAKMILKLAVGG